MNIMIPRNLQNKLKEMATVLPVVGLVGPRQSGKTTLVKEVFKDYHYVSLEDLDKRNYAISDPKGFLAEHSSGLILDEVQHVPELFSYIQTIVDQDNQPGQFILTGSQHFLLLENITQTLAGRIALLTLLPLSLKELIAAKYTIDDIESAMFRGFYPRIYQSNLNPEDWYPNYIQTYIERDIRQIKNVHDLSTFQCFVKMCASRVGQLLNLSSLANDCGITHNTAKAWISLLETSFIAFLLQPYHKNFGKRLIKSPKLYFYDTGLVCSLLGIENRKQLLTHYIRGALFENIVISELMKIRYNQGKLPRLYFWRNRTGHEIDCLIEKVDHLIPIEIKSSKTIIPEFFSGLNYWNELTTGDPKHSYLVYNGDTNQKRSHGNVISWRNLDDIDDHS